MKLKTVPRALLLALILAVALAIPACKPEDHARSAAECMAGFAARLNAGDFSLGEFAHSGATYAKSGWAFEPSFWEGYLAGDGSFAYTMPTGLSATATEAGEGYDFTLAEDEPGVYAIMTITRASDGYAFFE